MNSFCEYLSHPAVLIILGIVLLVILFYLIKTFLRAIIVSILILFLSVAGYHFYHAEGKFNERMRQSLLETKAQVGGWIEKGKGLIYSGKKRLNQLENQTEQKEQIRQRKKRLEEV
jgi:ABC-type transport system involved in cytochrome bd biosynthesis fused ATPase/permease subunit